MGYGRSSQPGLGNPCSATCPDLIKFKQPFTREIFAKEEEKMKRKKVARLFNLAESLNYQLTPKP